MKKIFLKIILFFLVPIPSFGEGFGINKSYSYFDGGNIYTNTIMPFSVAKSANFNNLFVHGDEKQLSNLKVGISTTNNIFGLIQIGDGGIMAAIKNGGISQIYYIETKKTKIYLPLGFIPIYVAGMETRVYGE